MTSCKVKFEGNLSSLESSLKEKLNTSNIKVRKISLNTALVEGEQNDLFDEVSYLKNTELQGGITINEVEEATENDKTTASSMGFEVINKEVDTASEVIKEELTTSKILEEKTDASCAKVSIAFNKDEALESLNKAVADTTLNSKTPLHSDDPFYYLLHSSFLVNTAVGVAVALFVSALF